MVHMSFHFLRVQQNSLAALLLLCYWNMHIYFTCDRRVHIDIFMKIAAYFHISIKIGVSNFCSPNDGKGSVRNVIKDKQNKNIKTDKKKPKRVIFRGDISLEVLFLRYRERIQVFTRLHMSGYLLESIREN